MEERLVALEKAVESIKVLEELVSKQQVQIQAQAALTSKLMKDLRQAQSGKKENHYQALLELKLGGKPLHIPNVGRTDVTTDEAHVEIKKWSRYVEVPGQLAKYQLAAPRRRRCVYFFGVTPSAGRFNDIYTLMTAHGIEMYSVDGDDEIIDHKPVVGLSNTNTLPGNDDDLLRNFIAIHFLKTEKDEARLTQNFVYTRFKAWYLLTAKVKASQSMTLKLRETLQMMGFIWEKSLRVGGESGPGFRKVLFISK